MPKINLKKIITLILGNDEDKLAGSKISQPAEQESSPLLATKLPGKPVQNIKSQKILLLKKALEFDVDFAEKAESTQTFKAFLLFLHQEFFFKIETLHQIGVVSEQSYKSFKVVVDKSEVLLSNKGKETSSGDDLASENESLKRQLSTLYKKHVKSDIICENELILEEEKAKLRSRLDDLTERYRLSQKANSDYVAQIEKLDKIKAQYKLLAAKYITQTKLIDNVESSTIDTAELESKIRHLTAKIEHQDRLINVLSYENPSQTSGLIQNISTENETIRKSIDINNEELNVSAEQIIKRWPEKSFIVQQLKEVSDLYAAYESQNIQIHESECTKPTENPAAILDDLQNDATTLRSIESIKNKIKQCIASAADNDSQEDSPSFDSFAQLIDQEKEALQQALEQKQKQLESLHLNGETRCLTEKITHLISQDNRLSSLVEKQNKIITNLRSDRKLYHDNLAQLKKTIRENKKLSLEIAKIHAELKNSKKIEADLKTAKKTCYSLQSTLNKQIYYTKTLEEKVTKLEIQNSNLIKENNSLTAQYDKLFDDD